jgi:hypothetical protein
MAEQSFLCPITYELMHDPVLLADGHTFERSAIEQWLQTNNTSPMTQLPLANKNVVPNYALRMAIESHLRANTIPYSELQLDGVVGRGCDKTVYRGHWKGSQVAVLQFSSLICDTEFALMQRLGMHPNVVAVHGKTCSPEGKHGIVCEFAALGSLDAVLDQHR